MLTGRFQLAAPGTKLPTKTAVVLGFGPRPAAGEPVAFRATRRAWTRGVGVAAGRRRGRRGPLPGPDPDGQGVPRCRRASSGRSRASTPTLGPDADDPGLTLPVWQARIKRHPGELKNLLKNQEFIAGIGNAYSDEILHAARLLPFRKRSTLAPEEVAALHAATGTTLANAIDVLRERVPPTFETQVRDFLAVHNKGGQPCPRCGTRISEVSPGRLRDVVLPRLPALIADAVAAAQGSLRTSPGWITNGLFRPLRSLDRLGGRVEAGGDRGQRVAGLHLVGGRLGASATAPALCRAGALELGPGLRCRRRRRLRRRPWATGDGPRRAGVGDAPARPGVSDLPIARQEDRPEGDDHQHDQADLAQLAPVAERRQAEARPAAIDDTGDVGRTGAGRRASGRARATAGGRGDGGCCGDDRALRAAPGCQSGGSSVS